MTSEHQSLQSRAARRALVHGELLRMLFHRRSNIAASVAPHRNQVLRHSLLEFDALGRWRVGLGLRLPVAIGRMMRRSSSITREEKWRVTKRRSNPLIAMLCLWKAWLRGPCEFSTEYLDPLARMRKEGVGDTVVMFGSARILPRDRALANLQRLQRSAGRESKGRHRLRCATRALC